jgi:hypothetical protein
MKMNTLRRFVPAVVLGLTIAIAGVGLAQNATQSGDNKKAESCCCCGDSCDMKSGDMKNHAMAADKHECCSAGCCSTKDGTRSATGKHECCAGDSCSMMKKEGMKNHAAGADKEGCCCGDSCNMKHDGKMNMAGTKHDASAADKHECCCCGDSCDMKEMKSKDSKQKP